MRPHILHKPHPEAALEEIETQLGEVAALLVVVADALTYDPGALAIERRVAGQRRKRRSAEKVFLPASEWPTLRRLERLLGQWQRRRASISSARPAAAKVRRNASMKTSKAGRRLRSSKRKF